MGSAKLPKILTFTLVLILLAFFYGCSETQREGAPEIFYLISRSPALNSSRVSHTEPLSLTFNFPLNHVSVTKDNLFTDYFRYGAGHTAGTPELSSASLSWSNEYKTLTISGISGWKNLDPGAGPKQVEIESAPGMLEDISDDTLNSTLLWRFALLGIGGVQTTSPLNNAVNVSAYISIEAIFSESMEASTINTNSFSLHSDLGEVSGSVTYDASTKTAVFTPHSTLAFNTPHVAALSPSIKDIRGNILNDGYSWDFITAPQPGINAVYPTNEAQRIGFDISVLATFESDMNSSKINSATFTLTTNSTPVAGSVSYEPTSKTAIFTPASRLSSGTDYTARLSASIRDSAGQPLTDSDYTWSFKSDYAPNPSVSVASEEATFTWSAVPGATSYNLYWNTSPGVNKTNGFRVSGVTSPYTHTNLSNGTTYYYVMTAIIDGIEGSTSNEIAVTPPGP